MTIYTQSKTGAHVGVDVGKRMEASHRRMLKAFEKEIDWVEGKLDKAVENESVWAERRNLLFTVPGVGKTLVYTLLADLPELGTLSNKQAAALVGEIDTTAIC